MQTGPKKSLGQHFLHDENIARKIIRSLMERSSFEVLVEVGPGRGVLTQYLVKYAYPLRLIELDRTLAPYLQKTFPAISQSIFEQDVLTVDLKQLFPSHRNIGVIGNFPYNISSQIIFWVLEQKHDVSVMVGMFQKEVGKRLTAFPGSKDYGILSVLANAYYQSEYLFDVSAGCFSPPPNVTSGVVCLTRRPHVDLSCDEALFKRVVKTAFGQRRKTLRNSLKPFDASKKLPADLLQQRAEDISVETYISITKQLQSS